MQKVSIVALEQAQPLERDKDQSAILEARRYFAKDTSIQLDYFRLQPGGALDFRGDPGDCLIYVWRGSVDAGGRRHDARSSMIAEYDTSLQVTAGEQGAEILVFATCQREANSRSGGHVHLLPSEHVPNTHLMGGDKNIYGALHADSQCPTCSLWLHENDFILPLQQNEEMYEDGPVLHSHSEDEVIFVREGSIGLGNRTYGPGTAIFIAADTVYRFSVPQEGLSILNFRGTPPTYTSTTTPLVEDEAKMWLQFLDAPRYLEPIA